MTVTRNDPKRSSLHAPPEQGLPAPVARYRERVKTLVDERIPDEALPQRLALVLAAGRVRSDCDQAYLPARRKRATLIAAALALVLALNGLVTFATSARQAGDDRLSLFATLELLRPVAPERSTGTVRLIVFRQTGPADALWLIGRTASADRARPEYLVLDEVPRLRGSYTYSLDDLYQQSLRRDFALWVMRSYGEDSARTIDHLRTTRSPSTTEPPAVVASRPLLLRAD